MCEGYAAGMEGDAAVRVRARRTVFEVALDRAAEVGELAADLVVASGEKFHLNEPVAVGLADLPIIKLGKLGILTGRTRAAYI